MRKTETVVVPEWGGRDVGKTFLITEKNAIAATKWGDRMFLALKGVDGFIPAEVAQLGMIGVAIRGINTFLSSSVKYEDLEPLFDELLECVQVVRDPRHPEIATRLLDDDIEEPRTVGWLRSEVLRVHTGFSFADALWSLVTKIQAASVGSPTT